MRGSHYTTNNSYEVTVTSQDNAASVIPYQSPEIPYQCLEILDEQPQDRYEMRGSQYTTNNSYEVTVTPQGTAASVIPYQSPQILNEQPQDRYEMRGSHYSTNNSYEVVTVEPIQVISTTYPTLPSPAECLVAEDLCYVISEEQFATGRNPHIYIII